ncbi:acyl-homoserine-lactone synthase [Iodidimonas sp. SYSU 1G8]|uniref:acyl-homoserine-lactone synthase n=1 Tax=Iodidimonas sp. SYSU 1G8 TaxID=3133967 RepID=UPI0031FEC743
MIDCITCETAHMFGDAIASQHRLRYKVFIQQQSYDVPSYRGMEFDQFDTPAATYLTYRDKHNVVRAVTRVSPTTMPYMLEEVFPDMVTFAPLVKSERVWEGTRLAVDPDLPEHERLRAVGEMMCAYLEFGIREGIDEFYILMPVALQTILMERTGWPVTVLGETRMIGGEAVRAVAPKVSAEILARVRGKLGITYSVLQTADDLVARETQEKVA